jgi:hypothetical protein
MCKQVWPVAAALSCTRHEHAMALGRAIFISGFGAACIILLRRADEGVERPRHPSIRRSQI